MPDQVTLLVGADKQFQTINAAIAAADQMGGNVDIRVDAGTYTNDGGYLWDGIDNVTIEGVGGMAKIVDPAYSAGGKAAIVTGGRNIVLRNLDISGVTVPDGNGAAVRYDQGTLLLDNVHLHGNQDGILGAPDPNGTITIRNSEIDHNGTDSGRTHNIYIGDIAQFTLTNSYIHDANVGHEVKSRAENNVITNNRIEDYNSTSSYSIDLPNGGNATITGNVIQQGVNSYNHIINAYGEEGSLHAGTAVTFANNEIVNDNANGAGPLWANNGGSITGGGNTVWNLSDYGNGVSPSGYIQLGARPNPDATPATAPAAAAPVPSLRYITGNRDGGVTLTGTSDANSTVTVTDTVGGNTVSLGSVTTASNGTWKLTTHSVLNMANVHRFGATAQDTAGHAGAASGPLVLASTGADTLTGTAGAADVFAIMSFKGSDLINGFQTTSAVGATHDVIDFSGRGITSFSQVQSMMSGSSSTVITLSGSKTITLAGIAPSLLTASDFRYS